MGRGVRTTTITVELLSVIFSMDTVDQLIYIPQSIGELLSTIATNQFNWYSDKEYPSVASGTDVAT